MGSNDAAGGWDVCRGTWPRRACWPNLKCRYMFRALAGILVRRRGAGRLDRSIAICTDHRPQTMSLMKVLS